MSAFKAVVVLLFLLTACDGGSLTGGTETGNAALDAVDNAVTSGVEALSTALGEDPVAGLAALSEAALASRGCSDEDASTRVTIVCSESTHTATIVKDFERGCRAGDEVVVTGRQHLSWLNMGEGACSRPNKRPRFFKAIQGNGARQVISTGPVPENGFCDSPREALIRNFSSGARLLVTGCKEIGYSNYQSTNTSQSVQERVVIPGEGRIHYKADGSKLFDHTISTPTPLLIEVAKQEEQKFPVRKIASGEISVVHNIARYTVRGIYTDVKYDYNTCPCHPVSGTIQITATDHVTGKGLGTGVVLFKAESTGVCDSYEATFAGQAVTLSLGTCRGI